MVDTHEELERIVGRDLMKKYSGELFTVVSSLVTGDASTVVRGTVVKGGGKCGFRALRRLTMRFNPKTPAKLLKTLGEVVNPVVAKKVTEVPRVVEEWEVKVGRLAAEFEEVLT